MSFDAEEFLYTEAEQELDTKFILVPQGDYMATCQKVEAQSGDSEKTESGKWAMLIVSWEVDDPAVKEETKREVNRVRQRLFLDLTPDGKLDFGPQRNISLGQLYQAVGLSTKGTSPKHLEGQIAKIRVRHDAIPNSDDGEGNPVYQANVSSVRPA